MTTSRALLDVTQYVRVTSDPLSPSSLLLQSHRDTVRIAFSDVQPSKSNTVYHELGGEHTPLNIPMTETAVWALAMTERSALTVTEQRLPVEVAPDGGIGGAVFVQDQATPILDIVFLQGRGVFDIVSTMTVNTRVFTAVTGHGILVDEVLEFAVPGANDFMQSRVLSVVGDVITIDSPINYAYAPGDVFLRSTDDMRVDGSVTPQIFSIEPGPGQKGDITNVNLIIESASQMDYSKFGSLNELTNGNVLRVNNGDGTYRNLFNWKTNGQFIIESFGHYFQEKAGGGRYGFLSNLKYNGQQNRGVVIRLDGFIGNKLEVVIQDDLSAGLLQFRMVAYGSELQE